MNTEPQFIVHNYDDNDVLAFGDATYKVSKFKKAVEEVFSGTLGSQFSSHLSSRGLQLDPKLIAPSGRAEEHARWFEQGIDCEILQPGSQAWKQAKLKIKVAIELSVETEAIPSPSAPESAQSSVPVPPEPAPNHSPVATKPAQNHPAAASTTLDEVKQLLQEDVW